MKVDGVGANYPEKDSTPKKAEENSFKNCVWDQNLDGNYNAVEAENVARTALQNKFGKNFIENQSFYMQYFRDLINNLDFKAKDIENILNDKLNKFSQVVSNTLPNKELTNEDPKKSKSTMGLNELEITKTTSDNIVKERTVTSYNVTMIGSGFKMPDYPQLQKDGKYKMGHITGLSYNTTSSRFSIYRSEVINAINIYGELSNKENLTTEEQEHMKKAEAKINEARNYGYLD